MKLLLTGPAAEWVTHRLNEAAEFFQNQEELGSPQEGGYHNTEDGQLQYRNCYGEPLATLNDDGTVEVHCRRHQALYGAPDLKWLPVQHYRHVRVLETYRPDVPWHRTTSPWDTRGVEEKNPYAEA